MNRQPFFSIVTPNFNQADYLAETLDSLLAQSYPHKEIIVIDGGSTDASVDIIKSYEKHLAYWVSEKDRGQSHAINKGLEQSRGDYFAWVNSDDVLFPHSLETAAQFLSHQPNTQLLHSNYLQIDPKGEVIRAIKLPKQSHTFAKRGHIATSQPFLFYSMELIKEVRGIDEQYRLSMDIDLWMRLFLKQCKVGYIPEYLGAFRIHPSSATQQSIAQKKKANDENPETKKILDQYLPHTSQKSRVFWRKVWKLYQIINLNYLNAYLDGKKFSEKNWKEVLPLISSS